jgi:hypothetical protein
MLRAATKHLFGGGAALGTQRRGVGGVDARAARCPPPPRRARLAPRRSPLFPRRLSQARSHAAAPRRRGCVRRTPRPRPPRRGRRPRRARRRCRGGRAAAAARQAPRASGYGVVTAPTPPPQPQARGLAALLRAAPAAAAAAAAAAASPAAATRLVRAAPAAAWAAPAGAPAAAAAAAEASHPELFLDEHYVVSLFQRWGVVGAGHDTARRGGTGDAAAPRAPGITVAPPLGAR